MAKRLLTKKKHAWISKRPDVVLSGDPLRYNTAAQAKYVKALKRLVRVMTTETKKEILRLFESPTAENFFVAQDANIASQARILTNALSDKFNQLFGRKSSVLAQNMINNMDRLSKSNLSTSLKKLSGGLTIKTNLITADMRTIIKASVAENVALIKSISEDYLSRVQKMVMRSVTTGNGLETITPALEKYEGISERKAKNIALDQTRKVYNGLNKGRMEKIGVKEFTWIHSGGGAKPRPSHVAMNSKTYLFNNPPQINKDNTNEPPEYGIPGQAVNCKCVMKPVFKFNQ
jgi:uncharacterized protein with gpF-like domain